MINAADIVAAHKAVQAPPRNIAPQAEQPTGPFVRAPTSAGSQQTGARPPAVQGGTR